MNDPTLDRVMENIRAVFQNKRQEAPALAAETPLDATLGLKSLDYAELVVRLEGEFGFDPFSGGMPPRVTTIAELAALYRPA